MQIPKTYSPHEAESRWYSYWMEKGFFRSLPDKNREAYTIVIPPPNVTGILHMGHMLNNTIQDVLIRRARMMGKNACWVPGTDHASIATEARVVAMLKEKGIQKSSLTREEFLKYAWEWKEKYGGIILEQLKKLGASCDWDRTRFTMDPDLSDAVRDVFVDLYNKGQIYRGVRMVNWDPDGHTAVSDEEVIHKEVQSKLYYVKYAVEGSAGEWITVATTRPETILGDTAVCVNPADLRYRHLDGKHCIVPIVNRSVPVIFDSYVDMEFGTGALKITPAHDINDYKLGIQHKLDVIDVIAPDGKMSKQAGVYAGDDRFAARKRIVKDLTAAGLLIKEEDIRNKVGYSERTGAVIEPRLSMQWFLRMDKISRPALENVLNGSIKLIPEKFINTYRHWMENVHDWCISRQLWWGHRIPAWYDERGAFVVAGTEAEALSLYNAAHPSAPVKKLRQDEDVLDTWFSSWLWPISVFDGFRNPGNPDIKYYYPTSDLVTAPEILFFWVARMIIAGYEYMKEKPFSNVYLTGIVRDKQGRKMSKSLGNSPEALALIEKYGADGVRVGMLLSSPAGNDLLFDEALCEQGRNFANKVWNAFRLVKGWTVDDSAPAEETTALASKWFDSRFSQQLGLINDHYAKYRISEALMATYKLVWDDFCSWYLEMIKPGFYGGKQNPVDRLTYDTAVSFFEKILKLLHPFMPFVTEEIWHLLGERAEKDCLIVALWPLSAEADNVLLNSFSEASEIITSIRNFRKGKNIPVKEKLELYAKNYRQNTFHPLILRMANAEIINDQRDTNGNVFSFLSGKAEFFIPLSGEVDYASERARIEGELEYARGFLSSVLKKLSNERFIAGAKPEVIENERKKQSDAEVKIKALEVQLQNLG